MKKVLLLVSLLLTTGSPLYGQSAKKLKAQIINHVEGDQNTLIDISDKIWAAAEVAFQEKVSSQTLIDYAKANGFTVEEGVAETPTAFVASYGSGQPVIGILGEFDALPGISQKATAEKDPLVP